MWNLFLTIIQGFKYLLGEVGMAFMNGDPEGILPAIIIILLFLVIAMFSGAGTMVFVNKLINTC